MSNVNPSGQGDGEVLTRISDGIVGLLKEYYGKGPTETRTYLQDDLVVCLMRGGVMAVEQTLLDAGHGDAVRLQRAVFQEVMRDRFAAVVEDATGRRVVGVMGGSLHVPAMVSELFVLDRAKPAAPQTLL